MCIVYLYIIYIIYIDIHINSIYTDIYIHINIYIISGNRLYVPFFDGEGGGLQYSSAVSAGGSSARFTGNADLRAARSPRLAGLCIYIICVSGQWIE